ncbi:hydroxypyruvate isomerase [Azoarcus taiwanensis]|uniref:Hydroxypyruvate isomerase n=1 Tax=Azoarcus taiwanensis TaxID=666964 RepID=A0A972J9U5_9RHOO|nr:hydroxypyruvate isomerase [Azoarcus taiwanensis]NMG02363.1 hydroxypyruvate isomerase [Azoarcus taiwanensis]
MPRFAANLTLLFNELDFLDRFAAAAEAGFEAVEFLFPYAWPAEQIAERLERSGLKLVLHNLPPGNWDAGERGIACHPDRVDEFRNGVARGIEYAQALGCGQLNCLAGIRPTHVSEAQAHATFVSNLRFAAAELERADLRLLIEPINTFDMPGFFLNRSNQAEEIVDEVNAPNLYIQYDIYHAQRMEGELANTIARLLPRIAHMQMADTPGRHEPGTGEINYDFLFDFIDRLGYQGWIGCEYRPAATTTGGLGWFTRRHTSSGAQ